MAIFQLSMESCLFPPPEMADWDGLLAYGGDLSVPRLLNAYANGIFPWFSPGEEIQWWCPHRRYVIFPEKIHISRSMKKVMATGQLSTAFNEHFSQIMHHCRTQREGETWISDEMEMAYNALFVAGHALCVGVYEANTLVGGLYGVSIGKCYFGESMFSLRPNASKLALIRLSQTLAQRGFAFIDCQFHTPHLESMGGEYIAWPKYKKLLRANTNESEK